MNRVTTQYRKLRNRNFRTNKVYSAGNGRLGMRSIAHFPVTAQGTEQLLNRKEYLKGSFTIELSLIIPFILFLIWNILFLSFFLYDQCTAMEGAYVTALRTERWLGSEGEKEAEANRKYEEAVSQHMACAVDSPDISISSKDVTVGVEIEMNAPGSPLYDSNWSGGHRLTAEEWKPVRFIRNVRKAEKLLN